MTRPGVTHVCVLTYARTHLVTDPRDGMSAFLVDWVAEGPWGACASDRALPITRSQTW